MSDFNDAMQRGADAAFIAQQVQRMIADPATMRTGIALSHMIEDASHDGTFAAAVFDILAG